jgi:hypothetical protein
MFLVLLYRCCETTNLALGGRVDAAPAASCQAWANVSNLATKQNLVLHIRTMKLTRPPLKMTHIGRPLLVSFLSRAN